MPLRRRKSCAVLGAVMKYSDSKLKKLNVLKCKILAMQVSVASVSRLNLRRVTLGTNDVSHPIRLKFRLRFTS